MKNRNQLNRLSLELFSFLQRPKRCHKRTIVLHNPTKKDYTGYKNYCIIDSKIIANLEFNLN